MMARSLRTLILVLMVLWPAASVLGQNLSFGKWWHTPRVVDRLGLTESEITGLDEAFHQTRLNLIELRAQVQREQVELSYLVEKKALDEPAILQQYQRLEQSRVKLGTERFRFLLTIRKTLGAERFEDLMRLKKMRERGNQRKNAPAEDQ